MSEKITNKNGKITIPLNWKAPAIDDPEAIPKGDMPGDKVKIGDQHIAKAQTIFPKLLEILAPLLNAHSEQRAVVSVHGGSGVGKSEIGSLLAYYLNSVGIGTYVLSGDNYPRRIPRQNDAERMRVFRETGLKGLVASGEYSKDEFPILKNLHEKDQDFYPACVKDHPWLAAYQSSGRHGLLSYLGTKNEIDFSELNSIIARFKEGAKSIFLKRMGREENETWYDSVDFSEKNVLLIEWTHGNNDNLAGVDIPVLLNSTPKETLEHRRTRNRDGGTDSPFTTMVLEIEQKLLLSQASKAKLIVTKSGELISYEQLLKME